MKGSIVLIIVLSCFYFTLPVRRGVASVLDLVELQTKWNIFETRGRPAEWLVVISARYDLLASGSEQDGVLKLRCVAALDVAERRVGIDYAFVAQVLQRHGVASRARALQPPLAECQGPEVFVDQVQ